MFFFLSKLLTFLLMPLTWIVLTFLLGMIIKRKRIKNILLFVSLIFLLFFTNPFIANEVARIWEIEAIPLRQLEKHDIAVILSGVTTDQPPRDRTNYRNGADRVLHPIHLYKIGKIKKIMVTGGSGLLDNKRGDSESNNIKTTLLLAGIPATDIEIEPKASNTHENAVFSAKILNEKYKGQKYLLVTSAFHMRRSVACFRKENLEPTAFPVSFYREEREFSFDKLFIPSLGALEAWHAYVKEWFGMITYKLAGYI